MSDNKDNVSMDITSKKEKKVNVSQPVKESKQINVDFNKNVSANMGVLVNLKRIIDVCVSRGAFKSDELSQVGSVIDSLSSIIKDNLE